MATKFAPPPLTYAPPAQPNITVAYIAGPAVVAANDAIGKLPEADKTLDEVSAAPDTGTAWEAACATLTAAIAARDTYSRTATTPVSELHERLRTKASWALVEACEEEYSRLVHNVDLATIALGELPAPDAAALVFKVKALTDEDFHLCRGYEHIPAALAADASRLLEGQSTADPFMRGPRLAWDKAHTAFVEAEQAAYAHDALMKPLLDRLAEVRRKWSVDHDFSADPVAMAELNEASVGDEGRLSDELWRLHGEALVSLLLKTAPGAAELAVKMQLFHAHEGWELTRIDEVVEQLKVDARRLGRLGAYTRTDDKLHAAFAECRTHLKQWLSDEEETSEEREAIDARINVIEEVLATEPARSIEGIVAKLRVSFQHLVGENWSDHSILDPRTPAFREGIKGADRFQGMMWSAIEDLARIAGMKLEQAA